MTITQTHTNPLNVFKGHDGLKQYFNPDAQPPVPLVELPDKLNPFAQDGVHIFAKMLTTLPAQNVKALPALNMLLNDPSMKNKSIVEASSGSTVTALSMAARVLYDNKDTTALCTNKTELSRLRQLQFFGLKVKLYGGPAQPEIADERGIISYARRMADAPQSNIANPAQYDNQLNWLSHCRWTGPQLWKQLPEITVFCTGIGSSGCVTGTGKYLKAQKPSVKVIGVCNVEADPIPGPRPFSLFQSCPFPWQDTVDATESISSKEAYRSSLNLCREGIVAGPSSGMSLQGLLKFLAREKANGTLQNLVDPSTGGINCVFVCCDLPHQYQDNYFKKLGEEEFQPIENQELLEVDRYPYDVNWEIDYTKLTRQRREVIQAIESLRLAGTKYSDSTVNNMQWPLQEPASPCTVLDLRSSSDFEISHISGSSNIALSNLTSESPSPFLFNDTTTLVEQWNDLSALISSPVALSQLGEPKIPLLVVCYNGDTSRMAVAMFRHKGYEAYSLMHGIKSFEARHVLHTRPTPSFKLEKPNWLSACEQTGMYAEAGF